MGTSSPDVRQPEPAISEKEWNRILQRVEGGKVIPVIGEHLSVLRDSDTDLSLADYLARRLELPGPSTSSVNEIAVRYLQKNPRGLDDLYADIFQALPTGNEVTLPKPLLQLADIRDFNLFLTTSFDPYLALALNEVRFGRRSSSSTRVLAYEGNRAVDIPEAYARLDFPLVYHLFGKAQPAPIFALTDEDVLEFVHTLQATECQPPHLSEALRRERLLVLGTRLTGWLTRFFLRISSADRLRDARRADYVVDPTVSADVDQTLFFEHFAEVKLLPISPGIFVTELHRRWRERHPEAAATPQKPPRTPVSAAAGEVFLSYASEDLPVVKLLRERLEREAGVRVWLDKESLRGGDQWERKIADALRTCAVVVPIVSANVKSGSNYRYVRAEWSEAARLQAGRRADRTFIHPLLIDDSSKDDPAFDPGVRAIHWRQLQDEEDMQRFIAEVRAAVE